MAGVDNAHAVLVDVEHNQQERDVQVQQAAVFKLVIKLFDHPRRHGVAAEEHTHFGRQLGGQERRRHPLAHNVADGDRPPGRVRPVGVRIRQNRHDPVIVATYVASGLVIRPKIVTRDGGRPLRQQ